MGVVTTPRPEGARRREEKTDLKRKESHLGKTPLTEAMTAIKGHAIPGWPLREGTEG